MKRWQKRTLYSAIFILWLFIISLPAFAVFLFIRGEVALGDDPQNQVRLFVLQEEDLEGVGLVRSRPVSEDPRCVETRVSYLLWQGDGDGATSCQCYEEGALVSTTQGSCPRDASD